MDEELVVSVGGSITVSGADADAPSLLAEAAARLMSAGVRELTVDLSQLRAHAPEVLEVVASLRSLLRETGGTLTVTGPPPPLVLDALADAPLGAVFALYAAVRGDGRRRGVREGAGT